MARDLAVAEVILKRLGVFARRVHDECRYTTVAVHSAGVVALAASPTPSPTPSLDPKVLETDPITTIGAVVAIVFALAAAFIGYRIIRGGRGL